LVNFKNLAISLSVAGVVCAFKENTPNKRNDKRVTNFII
jgi:hypothetical protein